MEMYHFTDKDGFEIVVTKSGERMTYARYIDGERMLMTANEAFIALFEVKQNTYGENSEHENRQTEAFSYSK